jgi:hypothetical protein
MGKVSAKQLIKLVRDLNPFEVEEFQGQVNLLVVGFGITLKPKARDKEKAQDFITFLEDRRVLYYEPDWEHVQASIESVQKIREELLRLKRNTKSDSVLHLCAEKLRIACVEFLDVAERLEKREDGYYSWETSNYKIFRAMLARIRRVFGKQLLYFSIAYDVPIDERLASIIPYLPNHDASLLDETLPDRADISSSPTHIDWEEID